MYIVLGAIFIFSIEAGLLVYKIYKPNDYVPEKRGTEVNAITYMSKLDGTPVSTTEQMIPTVLGIMIDNHPYARPQASISDARVVYEAPVEGGITRYFGVFSLKDNLNKVGPVRSARPYFMDWLAEYGNSSYWHAGGSPEALDFIKQYGIRDVDELTNGKFFWRDEERSAPHNLYTNTEKWQLYAAEKNMFTTWQGWSFDNSAPVSSSSVSQVSITYGTNYVVKWEYEGESKRFVRFINNRRSADENSSSIYADTLIIQEMKIETIDEIGRKRATTIGEGAVSVFRDGKQTRGTWKKTARNARTRFYDENGKEISLKPGKIWIQVVPLNTTLEVKN